MGSCSILFELDCQAAFGFPPTSIVGSNANINLWTLFVGFGLASHIGVLANLTTIGVGKNVNTDYSTD